MSSVQTLITTFFEERNRWFLWTPVGIGLGIALYFSLPFEPSFVAATASFLLATLMFAFRRKTEVVLFLSLFLCIALGFNAAQVETRLHQAPVLDRKIGPAGITGRLMTAEVMPDGTRLTLKDVKIDKLPEDKTPLSVRIKVKQPLDAIPPAGSFINLYGQVNPPSEPVSPSAYDFRRQSFFMGIGASGWNYGDIRPAESSSLPSFWDEFNLTFERTRRALAHSASAHLEGDAAAMVTALLNGEQTSIAKDVLTAMRVSGLAHLLSISGIHVSMIGLLVYFPLRALLALFPWVALRLPIKKIAALTAILFTSLYALLVGPQAPTLRSTLMTGIMMFAIIADRRALSMRLVALSAIAVMLIAPSGIAGPSFQMSFAAVLAMVAAFEKPLDEALGGPPPLSLPLWIRYLWKGLGGIILTSLVATAATTPFALYHFQNFSFYGVVTNMLAIPLTSFWIMPCLLLTYIFAPFGLEGWFVKGAGLGVEMLIALAQKVAAWPLALLKLPAMPDESFFAIVIGGLWLCLWQRRWRYAGLPLIIIGLLYPLYTRQPDIYVAESGLMWAVKLDDGQLASADLKHDKFTTSQWQQRNGGTPLIDAHELLPEERQLRCDPAGCLYRHGPYRIAFPSVDSAVIEDCPRANIVVAPFLIRDCAAPIIIDSSSLRRRGAHTLTFQKDGLKVDFVRPARGLRPWSPGWKGERSVPTDQAD